MKINLSATKAKKSLAARFLKITNIMQTSSSPDQPHNPNQNGRISIAAARRILGMVSRNYSDEDVSEILDALYGMAEESFEIYTYNAHPSDD